MKMKISILLSLLSLGIVYHMNGQCPPFQVSLITQASVDSFQHDYPGCHDVPVTIRIEGDEIVNLEGLRGITSVSSLIIVRTPNLHSLAGLDSLRGVEFLVIDETGISDLQGLEALDSASFDFIISNNLLLTSLDGASGLRYAYLLSMWNNPLLTSLSDLDSLSFIQSLGVYDHPALVSLFRPSQLEHVNSMYIGNNSALQLLTGFEGITQLTGDIQIADNPELVSLIGLQQVQTCRHVEINGNTSLTSMAGLGSLNAVSGNFLVVGNEALINMNGLNQIENIGGDLHIERNNSLANLSGLQSLRTIGDLLYISNNDAITSLHGIDPLMSIGNLTITFNDALSDCSVLSICNYLNDGGAATIGGNLDGCLSPGEVLSGCAVATDEDLKSTVSLYPNPTTGVVLIDGLEGESIQIEFFNSQGIICRKEVIDHSKVDLSGFSNGVYILRIKMGTEVLLRSIVKE
jgi:hypothetical protein